MPREVSEEWGLSIHSWPMMSSKCRRMGSPLMMIRTKRKRLLMIMEMMISLCSMSMENSRALFMEV